MYELIAQNQIGKPGYETWINNKVVTVAELLREGGYHTYLSGKWHLSGNHFENGTWPFNRGFENSLTLLNGAANHFNGYPDTPIEKINSQKTVKRFRDRGIKLFIPIICTLTKWWNLSKILRMQNPFSPICLSKWHIHLFNPHRRTLQIRQDIQCRMGQN